MLPLTKFFHSTFGQVSAIIIYDVVRKAETENHLFDELNRCCCVTLADRLCFNPLCELVNCHQKVGLFVFGPFDRPDHIQPPDYKRPSNWNHPQFLSRHMSSS